MNGRNHNVTLGVGFIVTFIIMLLFLLNKTHEKLEDSRSSLNTLEDKYASLVKQFECKGSIISITDFYKISKLCLIKLL